MCQIQFIKRKDGYLTQRDIDEFFKLMELGSIDNNCAFGFFNDKVFHKGKGRFNLGNFQEDRKLLESNFIVGHNRLETTGDRKKSFNNHPFKLNDFILVHNGIIQNHEELRSRFKINSKIETDSYVILWLIDHFFQKSRILNRQKRICCAIRKTAKRILGQFSVFLYDRIFNELYYFKNSIPSFSFCLFDNSVLIGTTSPNNLEHVYLNNKYLLDVDLFKERIIKEVDDNKIYLINDNVILKKIGEIESQENYYSYVHPCSMSGWEAYDFSDELEMTLDEKIELSFKSCIGYVPDYKFLRSSGMIKIKFDERVLQDLSHFIQNLFHEKDCIFFDVDDLLINLEMF